MISTTTFPRPAPAHLQRGLTLIEVLVTLVLISVGLLGVAALQLTSLRSNQDAYVRSQASALAADILDRMRANQLKASEYVTGYDGTGTGTAQTDLIAWQAAIDAALPGAVGIKGGSIAVTGNVVTGQVATISIRWNERAEHINDVNTALNTAAQTVTFVTKSEI